MNVYVLTFVANVTCVIDPLTDKGCVSKNGWLLAPDNIHTSMGQADDAFLVLSIKIGGFKGPAQSVGFEAPVVGNITFVFDLKCESQCTFFFMRVSVFVCLS